MRRYSHKPTDPPSGYFVFLWLIQIRMKKLTPIIVIVRVIKIRVVAEEEKQEVVVVAGVVVLIIVVIISIVVKPVA